MTMTLSPFGKVTVVCSNPRTTVRHLRLIVIRPGTTHPPTVLTAIVTNVTLNSLPFLLQYRSVFFLSLEE